MIDRFATFVMFGLCFMAFLSSARGDETPPPTGDAHASEHDHETKPADDGHHDDGHHNAGHGHHDEYDLSHANAGSQLESPEEFKSDLAIWTLVIFGLLLLILMKFAWKPIIQGLDQREQSIAGSIDEAQRIKQDAQKILADYEQKLSAAADEVREMLEEARRDADSTHQRIVNEAQEAATEEKSRALREIELAKNQALEELLQESVNRAFDLAGQIVGRDLKTEDHARLIKDTLENLPNQN